MDRELFGAKVRACRTDLFRVSVSILRSREDAEDAVAEAVLRAWEKRDTLREERYFETWLIRICINTSRGMLRDRMRHPTTELTESIPAPEREDSGVWDALTRIEEKYRLPLVMQAALGMRVKEIAQALRITEGMARRRIAQAKKLARKELETEPEWEGTEL